MPRTKQLQSGGAVFTLEIDSRILEGYLENRSMMIKELGRAGITEAAIIKREGQLGLSPSLRAERLAGGNALAIRGCLHCDQPFASVGPQNRLCKRCLHKG